MKLGILKTDDVRPEWVEQFGEYADMFAALLREVEPALEVVVYDVQRGDYPADIDEVDGYLMTGSRLSVYQDLPWIHQLMRFVRCLHLAKKKLVGICFGHQLIAQALGGKTEKSAKGWGVGRHTVSLTEAASEFGELGSPISMLVSHQDQVVIPAEGAQVLASSEFCPIAMCQIDKHILSFQGHPEFVPGYAQALLDLRSDIYGEKLYQQAFASLELPVDRLKIAGWIIGFFRNK